MTEQKKGAKMGSLDVEKNRVTSILRCKVVIVGSPTVGKTSLCQMASSNGSLFPKKYNMVRRGGGKISRPRLLRTDPRSSLSKTVGVDLSVIPIRLEGTTQIVELFAYDVGGQDVFIDCCEEHLHDANYALLCFNMYDDATFRELNDWLSLVLKSRKQTSDPPCGVLVGNKADLNQHATMVNENDVKHWAASKSIEYFEVSALPQGGTWKKPFEYIAKDFKLKYDDFVERTKLVRTE